MPLTLMPTARREHVLHALVSGGFAVVPRDVLFTTVGASFPEALALSPLFDDLPADAHLKDGGAYRFRRHGCFVHDLEADTLTAVPHRAHYQPLTYNALHGGMERWFSPLHPAMSESSAFSALVRGLGQIFASVRRAPRYFVEAHAFRIDPSEGVGRPTPEGAHRDGVDFVAVVLVDRVSVRGGETRVFEADGPEGVRFSLVEPWSALLLDDTRVVHETTPIVPTGPTPHRDTLVITYREAGFQAP
jgi:hypothetical protein